jgi:hypothetical protein
MEINVDIPNLPAVAKALGDTPNALRFALHQSILYTLRKARTMAKKAVTERYNILPNQVLKALGEPRMSGLVGVLHAGGTRIPLSAFPAREISPFGTAVLELKNAYPINLLHSFIRGGKVLERETPETKRYPLRTMVGLPLPIMIGEKAHVFPEIEAGMEKDLDHELGRLVRGILSGSITPR